ncbi:MAG: DUF3332 domain-containing protein [Bacteroidales bacterium]|nr:DUF3332 domain-containing protein [Bacteroidales bacterium]MDD4823394.1 DUF3332 domain-containing protein [Bacteroidales bacterium]
MRKTYLSVGIAALIGATTLFSSCIGSFKLTNKVLDWNKTIGDKFVNEVVFVAMHIVPVYQLSIFADAVILNSIEFWTGENPVVKAGEVKEVTGEKAKYQVLTTENGYQITNETTKQEMNLVYNAENQSWTAVSGNESVLLLQFTSDNKAMVYTGTNMTEVELSHNGVLAFRQALNSTNFALK